MFAARDQENLIHGHQQHAASKHLNHTSRAMQPKTPGNRYPKTPLKVPLNDENKNASLGGKQLKGYGVENLVNGGKKATFDKNAFITPVGPRSRAPLGVKTTNAKAKAFQSSGEPLLDKKVGIVQQVSTRKAKRSIHLEPIKIEVSGHESPLGVERDVEYCPPRPRDLPYESEEFPAGCLNYEPLRGRNLSRGIYQVYHQQGHDIKDIDIFGFDQQMESNVSNADEAILKSLEEDLVIRDLPQTFGRMQNTEKGTPHIRTSRNGMHTTVLNKAPPTIASRKAASALAPQPRMPSDLPLLPKSRKPQAPPITSRSQATQSVVQDASSTLRHNVAVAASKSTIGYSKGRSTSHTVEAKKRNGGMTRSTSNLSQVSDITITPARFAQQEERETRNLPWLIAFEAEMEMTIGDNLNLGRSRHVDEDDEVDEEFVMKVPSDA